MVYRERRSTVNPSLIKIYPHVKIKLINCIFFAEKLQTAEILQTHYDVYSANAHVIIKNVSFTAYAIKQIFDQTYLPLSTNFITLSHTTLLLEDVVFSNISTPNSIISLKGNNIIIVSGLVEFSLNHVHDLINFQDNDRKYIILKENSVTNITTNDV